MDCCENESTAHVAFLTVDIQCRFLWEWWRFEPPEAVLATYIGKVRNSLLDEKMVVASDDLSRPVAIKFPFGRPLLPPDWWNSAPVSSLEVAGNISDFTQMVVVSKEASLILHQQLGLRCLMTVVDPALHEKAGDLGGRRRGLTDRLKARLPMGPGTETVRRILSEFAPGEICSEVKMLRSAPEIFLSVSMRNIPTAGTYMINVMGFVGQS
ncbi:hypothetical protein C8J57DRAFT_1255408 [Mycena rebaudengoi]|nr:hypothetical protein C8J57DRAFT_1255408 [Mycena rebaudengoi]